MHGRVSVSVQVGLGAGLLFDAFDTVDRVALALFAEEVLDEDALFVEAVSVLLDNGEEDTCV